MSAGASLRRSRDDRADDEVRLVALALYRDGLSYAAIADRCGRSTGWVAGVVVAVRADDLARSGEPRAKVAAHYPARHGAASKAGGGAGGGATRRAWS